MEFFDEGWIDWFSNTRKMSKKISHIERMVFERGSFKKILWRKREWSENLNTHTLQRILLPSHNQRIHGSGTSGSS